MPVDCYYWLGSAPCRSVIMLAKHLDVELNLKVMDLLQGDHLKPEFIQINPQHVIPTIVDDGFAVWESRAILCYLANKYSKNDDLYPKDPQKRAIVDRMLYFDMGTIYQSFGEYVYPQIFKAQPADPEKETVMKTKLGFFNSYLEKTKYAAGDKLTIADLTLAASLSTMEACSIDLSEFPRVKQWLEMLKKELPYYEELNQKGADMFAQWYKSKK